MGIFVKSTMMARELRDLYSVDVGKIRVITGGIDALDFGTNITASGEEFRKTHRISAGVPLVLFAGRLVPQKGLVYLVKAALELLREYRFMVVIAGMGDIAYTNRIRDMIGSAKRQDAFRFLGHVAQKDMRPLLSAIDCVATPSLYEPFGMNNLQAAYMGKTVITTRVTGSVEVLADHVTMYVVEPGSVEALQRALKEWLIKKSPPVQSMDFRNLSWGHVAQEIVHNFEFKADRKGTGLSRLK